MPRSAPAVGFILFLAATGLRGSLAPPGRGDELLRDLLAMVSPAKFERATKYVEPVAPDPADARAGSDLALLGYWADPFRTGREALSAPPTESLLLAVSAHPEYLPDLLPVLPPDTGVFNAVQAIYDRTLSEAGQNGRWVSAVHDWLMMHSDSFRDDLIHEARQATDTDGYVDHSDRLEALAALDWNSAEPVLWDLARGGAPRTAALALSILYKNACAAGETGDSDALRAELLKIVDDAEAPGRAIDSAIEALLATEWAGRDSWYFGLLEQPSLQYLSDDSWGFAPLASIVERDPDTWIPRLAALVESPNRTLHDQAVGLLVRFHLSDAREDALRPLLPWIADPSWSSAPDRLRLIQSVADVGLREAIPGLIVALENADEWSQYIAGALGDFGAREAIPALRSALQRPSDLYDERHIVRALVSLEGFSAEELAGAIERYADQSSTEAGRDALLEARITLNGGGAQDRDLRIGEFVCSGRFQPSEDLAKLLLARVEVLRTQKPQVAISLLHLLSRWSSRTIDRQITGALLEGELDAESSAELLMRRQEVRGNAPNLLRNFLLREGLPRGFAALLLEDAAAVRDVLKHGSSESRIALLAAARIVDEELPLSLVAPLLETSESGVASAAERYLETNDGPAARELLWRKYSGRAWILGHSTPGDPDDSDETDESGHRKRELTLRRELFQDDGPSEIFAWLSRGYWSGPSSREIRLRRNGAHLTCGGGSRELSPSEILPLLNVVAQRAVDDLGYSSTHVTDCAHVEYLHITRNRGRRVVMYCPQHGRGSEHFVLNEVFEGLACPQEEGSAPSE